MSETPQETISRLRKLLARTYRAATNPEWQEGECLNEVLIDVAWEGIDVPKIESERPTPTREVSPPQRGE